MKRRAGRKPGAAGWPLARYGPIAWLLSTCRDRRPRACSTGSCARTSPNSSPLSTRRRTAVISPGSSSTSSRKFLRCGVLSHGFARVRCGDCAFQRLVPFSCKGRAYAEC
ncbi:MAG: hypothetical protein E6J69_07630 [Deltaproteobacteria bacterium]|nr:MAG: hypothetical protein DMD33_00170 [Gemmatimonadota bacterium]TMA68603.1 MAG: hypothetical protein E6J69_07630 [Deltaproteobacteria bacterium]